MQLKGKYSKVHNCCRKIAFQCYDASIRVFEFCPCVKYGKLDPETELKPFRYCQKYIHGLLYTPDVPVFQCDESRMLIREFLLPKKIDILLYKGGNLERDLCDELGIESRNLEDYRVLKYVTPEGEFHDPVEEVKFFRESLIELTREKYKDTNVWKDCEKVHNLRASGWIT